MEQEQLDRFSSFRYGEGRTGIGQIVEFTCPLDVAEKVGEFLRTNIRTISIPTTGLVNVAHGGYGQHTRYEVVQHDYAGGGPGEGGGWGYIEVLEIKNPPDGRWGIVINERTSHKGGAFTEWETIENALAAFIKFWDSPRTEEEFPKLSGFKRRVACGELTPWFYAIGDEQLIGDYAFPEGLQDDAIYRFGRQFVVFDYDGVPAVKTCMGTRFIKRKRDSYGYHPCDEQQYRLVYWDDGSVWNESNDRGGPPRPVEKDEMWIAEAVQQFKLLLAGKNEEFTINFTDGNKFIGKLVRANRRVPCVEGDYSLVVRLKGEQKPLRGWVNDFKPEDADAPDIVQYVTKHYAQSGKEVEYIEVKECKTKRQGKKWSGVFFRPPH